MSESGRGGAKPTARNMEKWNRSWLDEKTERLPQHINTKGQKKVNVMLEAAATEIHQQTAECGVASKHISHMHTHNLIYILSTDFHLIFYQQSNILKLKFRTGVNIPHLPLLPSGFPPYLWTRLHRCSASVHQ